MLSLGDALERSTKWNKEQTAVRFIGTGYDYNLNYGQFNSRVNQVSNGLRRLGVGKGDRVAFIGGSVVPGYSPFYCEIVFGLAKIGAIGCYPNSRLAAPEFLGILKKVEPKAIIVEERYVETIESISSELNCLESFVCIGGASGGWESYNRITGSAEDKEPPFLDIDNNDVVMLIGTGGTTGTPKLAAQTHENWFHAATNWLRVKGGIPNQFNIVLSQYHIASMMDLVAAVITGRPLLIMGEQGIDPVKTAENIDRYKLEGFWSFPSAARAFAPVFSRKQYGLESLRHLSPCGEVADEQTVRKILEGLPPWVKLTDEFASTEVTGPVTICSNKRQLLDAGGKFLKRLSSCGKPFGGTTAKVVDSEGTELPFGEVGELAFKGPSVCRGYWNMPEETKVAFRDGWFYTGDLAYIDEDGWVHMSGRAKDMIKSGGENVYPFEIEQVILQHPAVSNCAVVGITHAKWGETPKAIVVLNEGVAVSEEDVIQHCKKYLASYKKPTSVDFVQELPRTRFGKVDKAALRKLYS